MGSTAMPLEKLLLYDCGLLTQTSSLRCSASTTFHPELQLQQAASDVALGQAKEGANITELQSYILSQTHQLEVATDAHLRTDGVSL